MRCERNGKVIEASERAFRVIYQNQGYVPVEPYQTDNTENQAVPGKGTGSGEKELNDMTVVELKAEAKKRGLAGCSGLSRTELLELLGGETHD